MTQEYISSEKLSWNASGIILGIGTLQVSLTLHNRLNNERKKIKRDYSLCKIIIVRPSNNYLHLSIVTEIKQGGLCSPRLSLIFTDECQKQVRHETL